MARRDRTDQAVPVFELYGEKGPRPAWDPIHVESIATRSSLHNWEIRPHRHHGLFQLLWLATGAGQLVLDDVPGQLISGSVVLVPQHCVHGFRFERDAGGLVLTLAYPMLVGLSGELGRRLLALSSPCVLDLSGTGVHEQISYLLRSVAEEYENPEPFRPQLLEALIVAVLALLLRQPAFSDGVHEGNRGLLPSAAAVHLERFMAEVERSFLTHAPLAHYASQLGVSAAHLNALCRRYAGRSALGVIHDRLMLEARRNLVYTAMTVREVAELLGFSDPAYFTRFFKRSTGRSPTEFRERADLSSGLS